MLFYKNILNMLLIGGLFVSMVPLCAGVAQPYDSLEKELKGELEKAEKNNDVPSTLLILKIIVDDAVRKGVKDAPDYNLCNMQLQYTHLFCKDNKGIERIDMPQLKGKPMPNTPADLLPRDSRGEVDITNSFSEYLKKTKKYRISSEKVKAMDLKATQNELVGSKVAGIWLALQDPEGESYKLLMDTPFFISEDNYILDGHHRWAALVAHAISTGNLSGLRIRVQRVHVGIDQLVKDANSFAQKFGIKAEQGIKTDLSKEEAVAVA